MRATIRDVAKHAGVSIATVSKVFNGYTDINEETKAKIFKVAKKLDYTPNMAARTLSSKRQKTIALILNELTLTRKSTVSMEVLNGVYRFISSTDYEFVFYGTTTEKQSEKTFKQFCSEHSISGAIVQGLKLSDPYYQEIKQTKIPTVLIDMELDTSFTGAVSIDNVNAAKEATELLIKKGHKEIAFINGTRDAEVSLMRENGYREALLQNNIEVKNHYIQYANYDEDIAYYITKNLLQTYPSITAIFCASDLMAIGAMRSLKFLGKKIPKDIALVGFDNIVLSEYVTPSLTTVSQDMELMGRTAAALLVDIVENKKTEKKIIVEHELIIRSST